MIRTATVKLITAFLLISFSFVQCSIAQTIDWTMKANPLNLQINSVAFRADGQKVLSGTNCHPASIRVFDVASSNLEWDYNVGMTYMCIMGVTFSSNSNYIVAIEEFGNIFVFDNTGLTPVITDTINTGTSYGFSTAISPDNSRVAVGCSNGKLKIYGLPGAALQNDIGAHLGWVTSVCYSPDGTKIITGGSDDKVKIWTNTGVLLYTCTGHSGDITSVKVTPDNNYIVSSSKDNKIKIWNISNGTLVRTIVGHTNYVNGVDLSPDGSKIVSGSSDATCKIWDFATGNLISTFGVPDSGAVYAVAWSPSGDKIVSGNEVSDVVLWSVSTTLGVSENPDVAAFHVSLNKSLESLHATVPAGFEHGKILLYNEMGQLLKAQYVQGNSEAEISIPELMSGVYCVILECDNRISRCKITLAK